MASCTALRQYHLRSGDERAAILIARLANAVYEETHDPFHSKTLPNIDYYYCPTLPARRRRLHADHDAEPEHRGGVAYGA